MFGSNEMEAAYLDYGMCSTIFNSFFLVSELWREFVDSTLEYRNVAVNIARGNQVTRNGRS